MPLVTTAKVVALHDRQWEVTEVPLTDLVAFMKARGHGLAGLNQNIRNREELQGQPKFTGILGPMWDGGMIRYECPNAYRELSQ